MRHGTLIARGGGRNGQVFVRFVHGVPRQVDRDGFRNGFRRGLLDLVPVRGRAPEQGDGDFGLSVVVRGDEVELDSAIELNLLKVGRSALERAEARFNNVTVKGWGGILRDHVDVLRAIMCRLAMTPLSPKRARRAVPCGTLQLRLLVSSNPRRAGNFCEPGMLRAALYTRT